MSNTNLHVREFKYRHKKVNRFRVVKLADTSYRIDYKYRFLGIFPCWDKKLKYNWHLSFNSIVEEWTPLIFNNVREASFYLRKATRKKICFVGLTDTKGKEIINPKAILNL
jgi:hypothetical protein